MKEQILQFMEKQSCASICCIDDEEKPYCFSCFYAFDADEKLLYFKSSGTSRHAGILKQNPYIAGTVLPDKFNRLLIKGVQFEGVILDTENPVAMRSLALYHKKFPMALAIPGDTWIVQLNHVKLTDSTVGFGKKLTWAREPATVDQ